MHETLDAANGVGLAAVQVGVLWRVALVKEIYNGEERTVELINPEIITQSMPREGNEMCLSVPDECHILTRPHRVTVRAFDRNGGQFIVKLKNLSAVCACHEIDHLDGILYIDRVGK
jgi:peptide deformylase